MTFETATKSFNEFADTGAPTTPGVLLRSRGKYYTLSFDLQLIEGKIAIVAKQEALPEPTPDKPAKKR